MEKCICKNCNKETKIYDRKLLVCKKCYYIFYEAPKSICLICKKENKIAKNTEDGPICIKCYNSFFNNGMCCECKEIKVLHKITPNGKICQKCYNSSRIEEECSVCHNISIVVKRTKSKEPICRKCWEKIYRPKRICSCCKSLGKIYNKSKEICQKCYVKYKRETDEKFRITSILRDRVKDAFKCYSKSGKIKKSKEYGINYKAIFDYIGPCPGEKCNYEIDHIFPLSAFNFDNPIHIKLAFAPENHQWLSVTENRKKYCNYNKLDFEQYLKKG